MSSQTPTKRKNRSTSSATRTEASVGVVDASQFRDLRFSPKSQLLTKDKAPFSERSKIDFVDVIEQYRAALLQKKVISEFYGLDNCD